MRPAPSRMHLRLRGQLRRVARFMATQLLGWRAAAWIGTWTASGLATGLIARVMLRNSSGVLSARSADCLSASAYGSSSRRSRTGRHCRPGGNRRTSRTAPQRPGLGPASGADHWYLWGYAHRCCCLAAIRIYLSSCQRHAVLGARVGIRVVAATGMWIFPGMVWAVAIARCWLALRDCLPWNLMAFLDDAHRRGVLRQSGGVYQFRHARLQQYLAMLGSSPGAPQLDALGESTLQDVGHARNPDAPS